jgi:pimeloyl-ACP methyl ester carboxylesterase
MAPIGPGYDWGQRSPGWAGITSGVVDVGGTRVHYLRAGRHVNGPTHLLVHPMGTGAWPWMDAIGPLSAHGPVIAPDLPGSGRTRPLQRGPGDAFAMARFLDELTVALGQERIIVHGHSLGGLVGALFAARVPDRVDRLVLTSAPLPGLPDPPPFPAAWRLGLRAGRPVAEILVAAGLRLKAEAWGRMLQDGDGASLGPEVARMSPALRSLAAEEIGRMRVRWRA